MSSAERLKVVLVKPSKYSPDGFVERFRLGSIPNSTLPYLRALTPESVAGARVDAVAIDEYVQTDLDYLRHLEPEPGGRTLVALVGVQSHQFHRALDLAAMALDHGAMAVMGGPHPMTCDTSAAQGVGVSFSLSEAELVWSAILRDAVEHGELAPVYGGERRWQEVLDPPVLIPPSRRDLARYASRMLGVYPARGCPYRCSYCSIIKIAGHQVRSQPVATTLETLRAARRRGVRAIFFVSDNFNKYAEAWELCEAMVAEDVRMPFVAQCDLHVLRQPQLVEQMARAGCYMIYLGVESFDRRVLTSVRKFQNRPERYREVVELCRSHGVTTTFANILGFPMQNRDSILEHLEVLLETDPDLASFYVLTPIPGTDQYEEFRRDGWIVEPNLDRFDASSLVWRHPSLDNAELQELVYHCYRRFYRMPHALQRGAAALRRASPVTRRAVLINVLGDSVYSRWVARRRWRRARPNRDVRADFSGGIGRVRLDHVDAYLGRRRERYGFELAPLPASLSLSEHDERLNRAAKLVVPGRGGEGTSPAPGARAAGPR